MKYTSYTTRFARLFLIFLIVSCNSLFAQVQVSTLISDINASGGMTIDSEGNFYVSDFGPGTSVDSNSFVYRIDKDDFSVSVFSDGFIGASGACFDSQGNFYQANNHGNRISKIYPDGTKDYDWATAGIDLPIGVIADSDDNIFVCNCSGNNISKITPDGTSSSFAEDPLFNCPNGLTVDDDDNLYACNFSDGKVLKITPDGEVSIFAELTTLTGGPNPVGNGHITYSNGYLLVSLIGSGQVYSICLDGTANLVAGAAFGFDNTDGSGTTATFSKPNGIVASVTGDTLLVNCSVPTWLTNPTALHPGKVRMITGVNSLMADQCEQDPVETTLFSQITEGHIVDNLTISMGSSWGDYDNDGDMDVFVAVGAGNNQLYQNNGDLTFNLVDGIISNDGGSSGAAIWGDYDNDGYLDLYVSNNPTPPTAAEANFLYKNAGPPSFDFVKVLNEEPATVTNYTWSSSWVDFDNDGDLDLHVPENRHLGVDYFFENHYSVMGGAQFFTAIQPGFQTDTIESTGVVSWMDYDNDCDQDLFMIKSGRSHPLGEEENRVFHNNLQETGTLGFARVTTAEMVNHVDKDFQASWGDYDNDGDMDVYLGNFDGPNYLYRNEGDSLFTAIVNGALVTDNTKTLGSSWGDYDNDGDLDLFVSNTFGQPSAYYENDGIGNFTRQYGTIVGPPVINLSNTQSCSNADINNDGYLDLFLANAAISPTQLSPDFLYLNNGGENSYLMLSLRGTHTNTTGIGAKVRLKTTVDGAPKWQMRIVSGSPTGDRAQNSLRVHFGLGSATIIDSLIIEWSNCQKDIFTNVYPNQICEVVEGGLSNCLVDETNTVNDFQPRSITFEVAPNPVQQNSITIFYETETADSVRILLYDISGQLLQNNQSTNSGQFELDVTGLAAGTYIVNLRTNEGNVSRKIIVK